MDDAPRRGRPPREEIDRVEMGERRRKKRTTVHGTRLGVSISDEDLAKYEFRWINDEPARIFQKTKEDDWDIVSQSGGIVKEDSDDLGQAVSKVVGAGANNVPMKAYLCRKPKAYYEADKRSKAEALDEQLKMLRRGRDRDGASISDYIPDGGISI